MLSEKLWYKKKKLLIFFQVIFLAYTAAHSDFNRITTGFDENGNVCGFSNEQNTDMEFNVSLNWHLNYGIFQTFY
jgi:hypothetical protein